MNTVLSYQNPKSNGRDILVVNGEISEYRSTNEQKEAQKFTMPIEGMKQQNFLAWWFRMKGASSTLRMYFAKEMGVLLVSNLLTRDEANRKMVFTFFSDEVNKPLYVRKLMEDYCAISNVEPNPQDCDAIEKLLKFHKNKRKCLTFGIVVFVFVLIICIKLCK